MYRKPTVALYLDIRRPLKSGKYLLRVRVNFNVKHKTVQKYYSTGIELSKDQWEKMNGTSVPRPLRADRLKAAEMEKAANDLINKNPKITISQFEMAFVGAFGDGGDLEMLFNKKIAVLNAADQVGSARMYEHAKRSLLKFQPALSLRDLTPDLLQRYSAWFTGGKTTVGIYLRHLRAIVNSAIKAGMMSRDAYPFGEDQFVIPTGRKAKKALSVDQNIQMKEGIEMSETERKYISFWLFSYFGNGMNFSDMAHLKPENIQGDTITFVRRKTMRTRKEQKPIVVILRDEMKAILKEFGNHRPYCFGVVKDWMNADQAKSAVKQWMKYTNTYVNKVAVRMGIPHRVTTSVARHTFATTLMKNKVDLKAIQESLGHSSIATTEHYLADLNIEEAKKISELL